jgi:uncharacterized membrane protein
MIICLLFAFGATFGWVLELLFRRFYSSHKWINPGFLVGPYLPLYGFGVAILFILSYYIKFDEWFGISPFYNIAITLVIMAIMMTVIEYIAGIIFIKGMGIKLWDYSGQWGNFQGIICPLFSFFWAIIAVIFYFFLKPVCLNIIEWFTVNAYKNIWLPFLLGMFYGVVIVDFCYSIKITKIIRKFAKENKVIIKLETFKEQIRDFQEKTRSKINFIFPLKTKIDVVEHLTRYIDTIKDKISILDKKSK